MRRRIDLSGQRFGRLTVVGTGPTVAKHTTWRCRCDCGAESVVQTFNLINGLTRSCGCYRRDRAREMGSRLRIK